MNPRKEEKNEVDSKEICEVANFRFETPASIHFRKEKYLPYALKTSFCVLHFMSFWPKLAQTAGIIVFFQIYFIIYVIKDHKRGTIQIIAPAVMGALMAQQIVHDKYEIVGKNGGFLKYMIIAFETYLFC